MKQLKLIFNCINTVRPEDIDAAVSSEEQPTYISK